MQKFDQKVNVLLNEILGSLASGVGSFLKAAEDPKTGVDIIRKSLQDKGKKQDMPLGSENKPKVGKMAVYSGNHEITGRIRTKINNDGKFGIQLAKIESNGKISPSEFSFVKTKSKPYWRVEYNDVIWDKHNNGTDKILDGPIQSGKVVQQISPSKNIPYVLVGKGTRYEKWIDWKTFQKSNKN